MTLPPPVSHILLLAIPGWGHVRPLLILATRLVLERESVVVTVLLAPNVIEGAHSDIDNQFCNVSSETSNAAKSRIRLVSTFNSDDHNFLTIMQPFAESYAAAYDTLLEGKPITCATKGTVFEALPRPVVIITDYFALPQLQVTRARTGRSIPVAAFIVTSAAWVLRLCGPEHLGGRDLAAKADAEAARTGRPVSEVASEIYKRTEGAIVSIPGHPEMYDYEYFPQKFPFDSGAFARDGYEVFKDCDALMVQTCNAYETSGSLEALKSWLAEEDKGAYSVGPLLPLGYGVEDVGSRGDSELEVFMATMHRQYGEKSVTFISFGTIFWPMIPEYLDETIDAFIEKKAPFVSCYASPLANLSHVLIDKVTSSGLGYLSKWAPQQYILTHPVTGWFLTHSGKGGVTEALGSGIPLICWPFEADQPALSAHVVENLKVAIELIEVRSGEKGIQPMLRNGRSPKGTREAVGAEMREVIDMCRGVHGQALRMNAQKIKEAFADSWREGGAAKAEIRAFLDKYL